MAKLIVQNASDINVVVETGPTHARIDCVGFAAAESIAVQIPKVLNPSRTNDAHWEQYYDGDSAVTLSYQACNARKLDAIGLYRLKGTVTSVSLLGYGTFVQIYSSS